MLITKKDILVLGVGATQGLDDTTITAEVIYPINFTKPRRRFVLRLHYNGSNSKNVSIQRRIFKNKKTYSLCLGNIFKGLTINNMKKTGLKGYVHAFSLIIISLILVILSIFIDI